jgi:hypothetical protein
VVADSGQLVRPATLEEVARIARITLASLLSHSDQTIRHAVRDELLWATDANELHVDQIPKMWRDRL